MLKLAVFVLFIGFAAAEFHQYNWNVTWQWANPDGYYRPVIHINNQFPGPMINVTEGDEIEVTVHNYLWTETISIHWHGMFLKGFPDMDGSPTVTQSHIAPYGTFTYRFNVSQSGTYWYHSHNFYQTTDGLWGPLIINRKNEHLKSMYDEERVMTVNDFPHSTSVMLMTARYGTPFPTNFNMPLLNVHAPLINGKGIYNCSEDPTTYTYMNNYTGLCNTTGKSRAIFNVTAGKSYRFRIINTGYRNNINVTIDGHQFYIVNMQGTDVVPQMVDSVQILVSQRVDVIVSANQAVGNYWIRATIDEGYLGPSEPGAYGRGVGKQQLGILRYDGAAATDPTSTAKVNPVILSRYTYVNSASSVAPPPTYSDQTIVLNITAGNPACAGQFTSGFSANPDNLPPCVGPLFQVNGMSMVTGTEKPLLYKVMEGEELGMAHGSVYNVNYGDVVDILITSNVAPTLDHVFHIHGYKFWVMGTGIGQYNAARDSPNLNYVNPPFIDSVTFVHQNWTLLRFVADNPGVWMLHCHMENHNFDGLMALFNIAPEKIVGTDLKAANSYWGPYEQPEECPVCEVCETCEDCDECDECEECEEEAHDGTDTIINFNFAGMIPN